MSRIHGHYHGALTFLSITDNLLQSATVDWMQYSQFFQICKIYMKHGYKVIQKHL